jgi:hypothetical protein
MKKKLLIFVIALLVLGLSAGAYAIKLNSNAANATAACCDMDCCKNHKSGAMTTADGKDSCCDMDCCKDGNCSMDCCKDMDNCPMKNKQTATVEQTGDMKNVVMMGNGENCCDHCKHKS